MNRGTIFATRVPLGLAYLLLAGLGAGLSRFDGGIAFFWAATGLLIADLISRPRREWRRSVLTCAVASALATGLVGLGWRMALPFALLNMVEALVAAWLFRRQGLGRQPLGSLAWVLHFAWCAGIVAPMIAAAMAAATLASTGREPLGIFISMFAGHALGNLIVAPLALLVARSRFHTPVAVALRRHALEGGVMFAAIAGTALLVFLQQGMPLLFLPVLPVIFATFRLGRGAAAAGLVIVALIGGAATLSGLGPLHLVSASMGVRAQFFQLYLAATVLTILPVAADLANRRRLHRALRVSEMRYRLLADYSTDILIHLGRDGCIRYISPSIRLFGGHDPEALVGKDAGVLVAPSHVAEVHDHHAATMAAGGQTRTFDFLAATTDGSTRWFETHARAIVDESGVVDGVLSVVRDVSARKDQERQMAADALTDPLTGLFNRRAFRAALEERAIAPGERPTDCLALFDIDHFKRVNDTHGHAVGDDVLRGFARVMRRMVRDNDVIARIGGEEFALLLPDTSLEQAMLICERLRAEVATSSFPGGAELIRVTVSGGVARLGEKGLDHAFEDADLALYSAKRNGRDQLALAA